MEKLKSTHDRMLLKDLRKAFIERALGGELRRLIGLRFTVSLDARWPQGSGPSIF